MQKIKRYISFDEENKQILNLLAAQEYKNVSELISEAINEHYIKNIRIRKIFPQRYLQKTKLKNLKRTSIYILSVCDERLKELKEYYSCSYITLINFLIKTFSKRRSIIMNYPVTIDLTKSMASKLKEKAEAYKKSPSKILEYLLHLYDLYTPEDRDLKWAAIDSKTEKETFNLSEMFNHILEKYIELKYFEKDSFINTLINSFEILESYLPQDDEEEKEED